VTRAVLAIIVQRIGIAETGGKWAVATSHGDSILFATAVFLLVAELTERADRKRLLRAAILLPILLVGMVENGRRLVWVMVLMMLLVTYLVSPMKGWKRRFTRGALVLVPGLALYLGAGWTSEARIFEPVKTLRGVTDTSYDHSAYWREVENWNIAMSLRDRPLLGQGLGGSYTEHMANDDISGLYREYREWPHNTVLGQLLLLGLFGFTAVWALFAGGLYLAFRSFRSAVRPEDRVAALGCAGALIACHMMGYGDTGAHYTQYKIIAALALAVAGKLAVSTGAWPRPRAAG
jgi:O-antigen ligase